MVIICTENGLAKRLKLEKIDGGQESYCRLMFKHVSISMLLFAPTMVVLFIHGHVFNCLSLGLFFRLTAVKLTVEGCFIFKRFR